MGGSQVGHLVLVTANNVFQNAKKTSVGLLLWKSVRIKGFVRSTFTGEILDQNQCNGQFHLVHKVNERDHKLSHRN